MSGNNYRNMTDFINKKNLKNPNNWNIWEILFSVWLKCQGTLGCQTHDLLSMSVVHRPVIAVCVDLFFYFQCDSGFSDFIVILYSLFYIAASCSHYRSTNRTCHTTVRDWRTDDVTARDQDHNALCRVMAHSAYKEEFKCCTLSPRDYRGTDVWRADWFSPQHSESGFKARIMVTHLLFQNVKFRMSLFLYIFIICK